MKSYKGFDKDLKCRGFQYEIGKTYKTDKPVEACKSGFHACEIPLEVFDYYAPSESRYCEVEQQGDISRDADDSKVASSTITIGAEIGLPGLAKAHVEWVKKNIKSEKSNAGNRSAATNTGDGGIAVVTGYRSKAKGSVGSALCICERGEWNGHTFPLLAVKATIIDGEKIKSNTWYTLINGDFVEVDDDY